jgi:hypothetical protein
MFSFQCACHFLHLVMKDVMELSELRDIISKVRAWVTFTRTSKGAAILSKFQADLKAKSKKLINVVK